SPSLINDCFHLSLIELLEYLSRLRRLFQYLLLLQISFLDLVGLSIRFSFARLLLVTFVPCHVMRLPFQTLDLKLQNLSPFSPLLIVFPILLDSVESYRIVNVPASLPRQLDRLPYPVKIDLLYIGWTALLLLESLHQ